MTSPPDTTAALEAALLAAAPEDAPGVASILASPAPEAAAGDDLAPEAMGEDAYIPVEVWCEQWGQLHDMAGGMIQMRTGRACPLGDQARSAGGQMAAQAVYGLMSSTPFLANMFLSQKSTFIGQVMVIGMHGFACVQIVKAANDPNAPAGAA